MEAAMRSFRSRRLRRQLGFSMVELLLAALVMGIGLLGLAMLQAMAIRNNTGSRSMSTAVLLAESILDDAQARGRSARIFSQQGATIPTLFETIFTAPSNFNCNFAGRRLPDTQDPNPYFAVTTRPTPVAAPVAQVGGLVDLTVTVTWTEGVGPNNTPRQRQVSMTRRMSYAND